MTNTKHLTEAQFSACDDRVTEIVRAARRDHAAKAAAHALNEEWLRVQALPQRTWQERQDRLTAIADAAQRLGLL